MISAERLSRVRNAIALLLTPSGPAKKLTPAEVRRHMESGTIRKILFIRPQQGIGDMLLTTPLFRSLKESYSSLRLDLLASRHNATAIRGNSRLTKVWVWDKKAMWNPLWIFRFLSGLRKEQYDLVIAVYSHSPSLTNLLLAKCLGVKIIWCLDSAALTLGLNWSQRLAQVEVQPAPASEPEWNRYAQLIRPLVDHVAPEPEFFPSAEDHAWAERWWSEIHWNSKLPKVGLFLAGNPTRPDRLWPVVSWVKLAERFLQNQNAELIAINPPPGHRTGTGKVETGMYAPFCAALGREIPLYKERGLGTVAALFQRLQLFLCPDGGIFHVAVACRVPTLGLFFQTDPKRWCPSVPWANAIKIPAGEATEETLMTVYQKVEHLLRHQDRC